MNRIFTAAIAVALALAGAAPARATTFPALTQIYVATGAIDNNVAGFSGIGTVINCFNQSGQTASVRYQFRDRNGLPLAGATLLLANLGSQNVFSGGGSAALPGTALPTGNVYGGSIQILSTQSAVYCTAMVVGLKVSWKYPGSRCTWCGSTRIRERWSKNRRWMRSPVA